MQKLHVKAGKSFSLNAQIAFWLVTLFIIVSNSLNFFDASEAWLRVLILLCCHICIFYIFYSWLTPVYFIQKKFIAFGVLALLLNLLIAIFRLWIETHFTATASIEFINKPGIRLPLILFSQGVVASFANLLRLSVNHYQSQQKLTQLKQVHTETELLFLKSQLNPHFLLNTINNLYALALEKSDKTPDALLKLSNLLRYYLYECNKDKVPLKKEWEALLAYRELVELKYETPMNIEMNLNSETEELIEPMLLVPLFENCFKHSDAASNKSGYIKISIINADKKIEAVFENSFTEKSRAETEPGGIGMISIQKRLELNYPDKHRFLVTKEPNCYRINLRIDIK